MDKVRNLFKFDPVVKPINIEMKEIFKPTISKVKFDDIPPDKEMSQIRNHFLATFPTGEIHK